MFQKQFILLFAFTLLFACGEAKNNPKTIETPAIQAKVIEDVTKIKPEVEAINEPAQTVEASVEKEVIKKQAPVQKETIKVAIENKVAPEIKKANEPRIEILKETDKIEAPKAEIAIALTHETWNALLQKYVSASGKVNYKGFKADKSKLQAYLDLLAANPVQKGWPRNKKMVYWINAYNAFTIKLIVDNYPTASITKINSGKPWDKKWIKLGGKTYSLNQIENDILRPQFKDARIHFAVNCAAKSCPPILNHAWTADNLNKYLAKQAKKFINDSNYNSVSAKKVKISKIFEWYAGDFGDIITYLNKYANVKINANAKIEYMEYNWDLNK